MSNNSYYDENKSKNLLSKNVVNENLPSKIFTI